ncbi:glycosyltransferase family 2 protein [Nakamurella lactea]|uniref:glycosyltransferase family 2 protein n=1 Tax=Nakamurella lactea TaxID=459515 RepID=UPI000411D1CE|nr:glycosyltransferase family 2 protein [Nakamurella lactea]
MPVVAAVVVTYNSASHLGDLLDSLPAAFGSVSGVTVVVDNGSTDGTLDLARSRTDCIVIAETNRGYGAGLNRGAQQVDEADFVLALNPDATLRPGSIEALVAASASRPDAGVVVPKVFELDDELSLSLRRDPTLGRVGGLSFTKSPRFSEIVYDPDEYRREHVVDWAMGAVMLIRRECWDALDGFDESYFLYSEETDFCLRARDRGWTTLYAPTAVVMHIGGGSGESTTTHVMKMVNRVRIYRRRHKALASGTYLVLAVVTEVRRALLGRRASWAAANALLRPSRRPAALGCSDSWLPK